MSMKRPLTHQLDLFAQTAKPARWSPGDRQKAVSLLQHLLTEALSTYCAPNVSREIGDEQDHG
jgi:hypothetical protein